ncbi:unnamed protein product [Triticum turgidum subsp. durum]|uniref:Protein kinase domain-containing protein n=1 Tax=Triticum turgidum subsp. durum TaxID=4567 RepID=A0A9R0RR78_TRITD|nr:unnamed protein product [Triticum turgidum subsp. durum]
MAHLPHQLLLLFLAVHVFVASHGSPLPPSSTYNDSMCLESFKCGGVDIKYPFYLSNTTQATPDYTSYFSCGYTDLKIFCQGEGQTAIAVLPLDQYNYTVRNIFYDNSTIILGDTEALSGVKCPTVFFVGSSSWRPTACTQCEGANSKGRCGHNRTGDFIGCLCPDGRVHSDNNCNKALALISCLYCDAVNKMQIHQLLTGRSYIIAVSSSIPMLCLLFFAFWLGYKKYGCKRKSKETARIESYLQKNGTVHPKRYAYAQVKRMTRSFAEKLGQGGFGAVYRGDLSDGRQIAVKMLKDFKTDGEDFINELGSISRTSHVNVVTLLGFCLEGSKRALIYDYMPNGSLERYAFKDSSEGGNTLGWEKLFDIAVGIARGLEYLHRGCNTRIVHFDIKPQNILLDQNFCPKISDFGLAKLCLNKESAISIGGARGTIGYIAPEVYSKQYGAVSSKSDVYSYGMMVLEMVGARDKNISPNNESSSQYFPQWIYENLDEYCVSASEINGEITEVVRKMIVVGLWCIQLRSTYRSTMTRVVEMLEGSTTGLELPPKVLLS